MKFDGTHSSTELIIRGWYEKNKRELPMRQTRDPYRTWVGEVILQQTRMIQGLPYYRTFLDSFPDIHSLATAQEDEVLKVWQGLGYYSRARNMHASAKYVSEQLGGVMPGDYMGLLGLKGVGNYTAAAIASWCYGEACAAVDGNVSRLIARLFGIEDPINSPDGERQVRELADEMLDRKDPGQHNQAMIEFGALQCIPASPSCPACPLAEQCKANLMGKVENIPVKIKMKKPVKRWIYYYMIHSGEECILVRRGKDDIWAGLYEFPMVECSGPRTDEEIVSRLLPQLLHNKDEKDVLKEAGAINYAASDVHLGELSAPVIHQLSHQTIHARFLRVEVKRLPQPLPGKWQGIPLARLDQYAMPRLIHRYLESVKI